jgi:hypothetical protein
VTKGQQDKAIIPLSGWTLPCRLHHCLNFFGGKKTTSIHNNAPEINLHEDSALKQLSGRLKNNPQC